MHSFCKKLLFLMVVTLPLVSCAAPQPKLVLAQVDLERVFGGWYIVATIPNWFEKGMVAPYDVFSRRDDGDIKEEFSVQWGSFDAPVKRYVVHDWVRPGTHNAHWRVQVFWPINLPFLVLYTDPDYQYILFGEEDRSLGWIFARKPTLDESTYQALLLEFAKQGYDTRQFKRVVHFPEQLGQPGYWSDGIKPPRAPQPASTPSIPK